MVNLKQVAALAGVSSATVSRALAMPHKLRPETLKRVQAAIQQLDYEPFAPARVLRSGCTRTIGIIAPTLMNELYAKAVDTLESELIGLGYTVLLTCHRNNSAYEAHLVRALSQRGIDGLAIIGAHHHPDLFSVIRRQRIPYVLMWAIDHEGIHPTVGYDNQQAMRRITEHLISLGHCRFGVLNGPLDVQKLSEIRLSGVRSALIERGINLAPEQIVVTPYEPDAVRKGARQLLRLSPKPTALICHNDFIAACAIAECRDAGISIADQLSVTGFGDWELARLISPSLTTVRSDPIRIGTLTTENLLVQINGGRDDAPKQIEFEAELIIRQSTGAAPVSGDRPSASVSR
ncbi:MAG: LacI family DNA-binding transcriptional regulator [Burkholderiales bacterium]